MKYIVALLIGRFQPFHLGHLYLLKKTLQVADKVVVGIGSASIFDENNPIDYETRKNIIKAVFYKEKIEERLLKIIPLEDFFDDRKWLENVKRQVGKFDLVVSNNDWTNSIIAKAGFKVKRFPYYKRKLYEGWRIRKLVKEGKPWKDRLPDYLITNYKLQISKKPIIFNHVVLGGTFDHFHKGHESLIEIAFRFGKKVTIGIATEELFKHKLFSQTIEPFKIRKKSVSEFLKKNSWRPSAKIIPFSEFTGGADKRGDIDAIVVSKVTYSNALKINDHRQNNKLKPLRIIVIKDVLAEDGELLSSERIRAGEIDRKGRRYTLYAPRYSSKELLLPEKLREELRKPLGKVFKTTKSLIHHINKMEWTKMIAVGDIIVNSLLEKGIELDIKVIDFRSRRKPLKKKFQILNNKSQINNKSKILNSKSLEIENSDLFGTWNLGLSASINKPGTINIKTVEKLRKLVKKGKGWLVIDGEEDLLALPAILFAPLGSLVLYGHWQLGVVCVEVTENSKKRAISLLNRFKI